MPLDYFKSTCTELSSKQHTYKYITHVTLVWLRISFKLVGNHAKLTKALVGIEISFVFILKEFISVVKLNPVVS